MTRFEACAVLVRLLEEAKGQQRYYEGRVAEDREIAAKQREAAIAEGDTPEPGPADPGSYAAEQVELFKEQITALKIAGMVLCPEPV